LRWHKELADGAEQKRHGVVRDEGYLNWPIRLHEQEEHDQCRTSDVGDHHQISPADPVRNRAGDWAKDDGGQRERQDHEADGGVGLRHVVKIDRLSNAQ
jgi:hypothetical protein